MAFVVDRHDAPAIEVCVNFGVFAGREATAAEIDRLAEWLLEEVGAVSIVAEDRHVIDAHGEASIHQVRIEVDPEGVPADAERRAAVEERLLARAWHWARVCVAERHAEIADGA